MANTDAPKGLRPIRHRNGAAYNGAVNAYYIPASYATALFVGDPVLKTGTANTTEVTEPGVGKHAIGTLPEINKAAAGSTNRITGVIVAFAADPDNLTNKSRLASTERIAYVCDDPDVIFEIQADGAIPATVIGLNANLVFTNAGSAFTGFSGVELNSATVVVGATLQTRILRAVNREDNDTTLTNPKVEVMINLHTESPGVGSAGI